MRENREKNDLVTKNFEIFPDVAADIINALLHNGKLVVTKENLLPAPTESIYTSRRKQAAKPVTGCGEIRDGRGTDQGTIYDRQSVGTGCQNGVA